MRIEDGGIQLNLISYKTLHGKSIVYDVIAIVGYIFASTSIYIGT